MVWLIDQKRIVRVNIDLCLSGCVVCARLAPSHGSGGEVMDGRREKDDVPSSEFGYREFSDDNDDDDD